MPIVVANGILISDSELACLENDIFDVDQWLLAALWGKIANCQKRLLLEWLPRLEADPAIQNIPADRDGQIALIMGRSDYRNRAARDGSQATANTSR